ncbi:MAG: alginate lyase family protein [Proteobacteria bacterium]|nr:alginate lyase family protein [Pseudomonadota bacterium]MBI3495877.1 alginate lyase family protein [Pseudomonadota bacterium]
MADHHHRAGPSGRPPQPRWLGGFLVALFLIAGPVPASAGTPYALISPERVAALASRPDTPEGKTEIRFANRVLDQAPKALTRIHVEGTLPHQAIYDESNEAKRDWPVMLDLALAYRLTGDERYRAQAERFLFAWVDVYVVSFNPIDESELDHLILVYDLLRGSLAAPGDTKMHAFLATMARGYIGRIAAAKKLDTGNWQSHRIKLVTLAAYALGDPELIGQARALFQAHVGRNIGADGAVWDFSERDALHYVTYDLEPLSVAALAAKAHGEDWSTFEAPNRGSLAKALAWLVPYAEGRQTHAEFVNSRVKFDAVRRDAGVAGFAGFWEPKSATYLYGLASRLDQRYAPLAAKLAGWHRPWLALCLD